MRHQNEIEQQKSLGYELVYGKFLDWNQTNPEVLRDWLLYERINHRHEKPWEKSKKTTTSSKRQLSYMVSFKDFQMTKLSELSSFQTSEKNLLLRDKVLVNDAFTRMVRVGDHLLVAGCYTQLFKVFAPTEMILSS